MNECPEALSLVQLNTGLLVAVGLLILVQIGIKILIYRKMLGLVGNLHDAILFMKGFGAVVENRKAMDNKTAANLTAEVKNLAEKVVAGDSSVVTKKQVRLAEDTNEMVHDIHAVVDGRNRR